MGNTHLKDREAMRKSKYDVEDREVDYLLFQDQLEAFSKDLLTKSRSDAVVTNPITFLSMNNNLNLI
jgi:hypothetical protein